jgi:hypothetical protein
MHPHSPRLPAFTRFFAENPGKQISVHQQTTSRKKCPTESLLKIFFNRATPPTHTPAKQKRSPEGLRVPFEKQRS